MSSVSAVVDRLEPAFNVFVPACLDSTYVYVDETRHDPTASWCPHPDLEPEICDRLVIAVGRLSRCGVLRSAMPFVRDYLCGPLLRSTITVHNKHLVPRSRFQIQKLIFL